MLVSLQKLIKDKEDISTVKVMLSSFKCNLDSDLEEFLYNKAIDFETIGKSRTYFIIDDNDFFSNNEFTIYGYYSLAISTIYIPNDLSNNKIKKLDGYNAKIHGEKIKALPCYLIGQLAKNTNIEKNPLNGNELMKFALTHIYNSFYNLGGRIVLVECRNKKKLVNFYESNNFKTFNNTKIKGQDYSQMLMLLV